MTSKQRQLLRDQLSGQPEESSRSGQRQASRLAFGTDSIVQDKQTDRQQAANVKCRSSNQLRAFLRLRVRPISTRFYSTRARWPSSVRMECSNESRRRQLSSSWRARSWTGVSPSNANINCMTWNWANSWPDLCGRIARAIIGMITGDCKRYLYEVGIGDDFPVKLSVSKLVLKCHGQC